MAMMNAQQYRDSLARRKPLKVYLDGKLLDDPLAHPYIRASMNSVALTYELAQDAEHRPLMTAKSALTGETVNRFCHLHQSTEDLINKVRMQLLIENLTLGRGAVAYLTESMHGAGSPQAQRVQIARLADFEGKKRLAKKLPLVVGNLVQEGFGGDGNNLVLFDVAGAHPLPPGPKLGLARQLMAEIARRLG